MTVSMTASDIYVMLRELKDALVGRWILNIYQVNGSLIFKISDDSPNKIWLVVEPGKRMHLTALTYEKEAQQRAFCKSLRRHLRDHKITAFEQHDFDRIIYLRAGPPEKEFTLVIELFGDGNAVLLDPQGRIVTAMTYRRMRDRDLVRGAPFEFPPLRGRDPRNVSEDELNNTLETSEGDIIRTLVSRFSFSGDTAEEILARSGIARDTPARSLSLEQRKTLHKTILAYFTTLATGQLAPRVVLDKEGNPSRFLPMVSERYKTKPIKEFSTFNEALDAYYSVHRREASLESLSDRYQSELTKLQRLLEKQQQHLETMEARATKSRDAANAIYQHMPIVEELLTTIREARQHDVSWQEIQNRLDLGKERRINAASIVERLEPESGRVHVVLDGHSIALDFRLSAADNANKLFQRSKQLERKVEGALIAIRDTKRKLLELLQKRDEEITQVQTIKTTLRRKKQWYEKFRWFITSAGLLVLGGRDSVSNQQLARKHLDKEDIFFHADITGAPVVILKTEQKEVTEEDLLEAAIFAASNSRAWRAGWTACDVYWVRSEQISLSAPTGEFLPKGAVMVRGTRNYLRKTPLRLAVTLLEEKGIPYFTAGPETAMKKQATQYIVIIPGKQKVSDIAKLLRTHYSKTAPEELQPYLNSMNIDEIIAILPPGPIDIESGL
ncbi:MAG: ribosome rescue protein RqcH [Promethearchaeota archaeon]